MKFIITHKKINNFIFSLTKLLSLLLNLTISLLPVLHLIILPYKIKIDIIFFFYRGKYYSKKQCYIIMY